MFPIEAFFEGVGVDEVILFTTFTLDEAVLAGLLDSQSVSRAQRIVVFHDVMRHRNPGYLKSKYCNAMVYTVDLKSNHPKRCPVFHSKIWARIQFKSRGPELKRLVITSANLSPYHLVNRGEGGTLESYLCIDGRGIILPKETPIFNAAFLRPSESVLQRGLKRCRVNPHSLIVDARARLSIKALATPLLGCLKDLGSPEACAAPFVCDRAIRKHLAPATGGRSNSFKVFGGSDPTTGLALHAKVMVYQECMAMGSVNWTAQAMGCIGNKPINHETLLLVPRDKGILRALRGFPHHFLSNQMLDVPADQDPDEAVGEDWLVERSLRINAPERAMLCFERDRLFIRLEGDFGKVNTVCIRSIRNPDEQVTLKLQANILKEPREASPLASIIGKGNVELIGIARGKMAWRAELDYGDFWAVLDSQRAGSIEKPTGKIRTRSERDRQGQNDPDVRDMRQLVIRYPHKGRTVATFTRWLNRHGVHSMPIPMWCQELAERLAKREAP